VRLNAVYGPTVQWLPDQTTLLCQTVPADRGDPPLVPVAPPGPIVQVSDGEATPVRTYADLLQNPHDEDLFDYYAAAQLAAVDSASGISMPIGEPGVFAGVDSSPDGRYLLVLRIRRPYSYLYTASSFPHDFEVWDRSGKVRATVARLPLQDQVPIEGVPTGPRGVQWAPFAPPRLLWVEALDGGDPKTIVPHRDRLVLLAEPFSTPPSEIMRVQQRFAGLTFLESGDQAVIRDYDRDRRWGRAFLL